MSKPINLSTILSTLFSGSDKVISEKLSADEHAVFSAEVQDLNTKLEAQTEANAVALDEIEASKTQITQLTESLSAAESQLVSTNESLTRMTAERNTFKAHYEKSIKKGDLNPDEDENSRKTGQTTSYNQNAVDVWNKANRS